MDSQGSGGILFPTQQHLVDRRTCPHRPDRPMTTRTLPAALCVVVGVLALAPALELQAQRSTAAPLYPGHLGSARLARLVDARLASARRSFEAMLAVLGLRTPANTLRPWDDAVNHAMDASG